MHVVELDQVVAVCGAALEGVDRDEAVAAGLVLDDHRLAPLLVQLVGHARAAPPPGRAPAGNGVMMRTGLVGKFCACARRERQRGGAGEQGQQLTADARSGSCGDGSIDVAQAGLLQRLAHLVHVQAEHAGGELVALVAFVGLALLRRRRRPVRRSPPARTTTPSSSATITSPGLTSAPAQTTGMLTEPSVALIVPLELIALLHTGKLISVRSSRRARRRR